MSNFKGFCNNCICGGLPAFGKCGLCSASTPYCNYKLCGECALKHNLCQACGLSPQDSDRKRAEHKAKLKEIPYMYSSHSGNNAKLDDVVKAQNDFKDLITKNFPEVIVSHSYNIVFGGVILIPADKEDDYKKALEELGYSLSIMV